MSRPAFEQFAAVRVISGPAFDPTGDRLAYIANTTGQQNIWIMPSRGGFPRQLTALAAHRVTDFAWSPDGERIAFTADHHGDEMHQIYVIDAEGGWPHQLTDVAGAQHLLSGWTPDGRALVVSANDRDSAEVDPQLIDAQTGVRDRLMTGGQHYAFDVSPDGRKTSGTPRCTSAARSGSIASASRSSAARSAALPRFRRCRASPSTGRPAWTSWARRTSSRSHRAFRPTGESTSRPSWGIPREIGRC